MLLCLPMGAMAAKAPDLWVTGVLPGVTQGSGEEQAGPCVHWWYSDLARKYYLFLPSAANMQDLTVWFTGSEETITIGGHTVKNGDSGAFLSPGSDVTVTVGRKKYTLSVMQSANVPAMFVTTDSGSLTYIHKKKSNEEPGSLIMRNADGSLEYDGKLTQIKGRGSASFANPKKSYQIKLSRSADLCGMGKAKTWILLAEYGDNSLLRDKIAFTLAQAAGMPYISQSQMVDLYVNGEYRGAYLLCEKVEIGNSRIDITDLKEATEAVNDRPLEEYKTFGSSGVHYGKGKGYQIENDPEDITGGYLLQLEKPHRYTGNPSGFVTKKGQPVLIKEPTAASEAQVAYISSLIQSFENAIFSEDGIDSQTGKYYSDIIDMDSLVKKYILEEFSKNVDANRTSFYLYKPVDSVSTKLYAGPVWDYDLAFGNYENNRAKTLKYPEYFAANKDHGMAYYWFPQLYSHQDFYEQVIKTYYASFVPALNVLLGLAEDPTGTVRSLDEYAAELDACAAMNFSRWKVFNLSKRPVKTGKDYAENIEYLKNFISGRMAFLAENWKEQ